MLIIALGLVFIASAIAFGDWRRALYLSVIIGLMMDPLRKLMPDQPVYFVVLVGIVFGFGCFGAFTKGVRLGPGAIVGWRRFMGVSFSFFVGWVCVQALHSLVRWGSLPLVILGFMVWLAPVVALTFSYQFSVRCGGLSAVRRWMKFYCFFSFIMLSGVYLEFSGVSWPLLGEVGEGITIYDMGTVLKANSGFFRASEIAAWHASTTACFLWMAYSGPNTRLPTQILVILLMLSVIALGVLTGRRKMLVEVVIFVSVMVSLTQYYKGGATRMVLLSAVVGLIAFVFIAGSLGLDGSESSHESLQNQLSENSGMYDYYAARGGTVFGDVGERASLLGLTFALNIFDVVGIFGAGLGTATQGTAGYFDSSSIHVGLAEGGLGKISMELGAPGYVFILWCGFSALRYGRALMRYLHQASPECERFGIGIQAFVIAKLSSFSVAAPAYSDLLVLLIMGTAVGFMLALPVLAFRQSGLAWRG